MNRFYMAAPLAPALTFFVFFHPIVGRVVFAVGVVAPVRRVLAWAGAVALFAFVALALARTVGDAVPTRSRCRRPASPRSSPRRRSARCWTGGIGHAINAVEGATAEKALNVNAGNAVLARVLILALRSSASLIPMQLRPSTNLA